MAKSPSLSHMQNQIYIDNHVFLNAVVEPNSLLCIEFQVQVHSSFIVPSLHRTTQSSVLHRTPA